METLLEACPGNGRVILLSPISIFASEWKERKEGERGRPEEGTNLEGTKQRMREGGRRQEERRNEGTNRRNEGTKGRRKGEKKTEGEKKIENEVKKEANLIVN